MQFSIAHARQGFIYLGEACLWLLGEACLWVAWPSEFAAMAPRGGYRAGTVAQRSDGSIARTGAGRASAGGEPGA